jgi:hypothetical protein
MYALNRISASFQPAGSDKFIDLGEVRDVKITDTITDGKNALVISYNPADPNSMKVAAEQLGAGMVELAEGKDYTADREAGTIVIEPLKIQGVYNHADGAQRVAAADAKRARRNAKRVADAKATAATAIAAATPWPNPPYVDRQQFFDGRGDWTFYALRLEWVGVTRTKRARKNAKRAAAKVGG